MSLGLLALHAKIRAQPALPRSRRVDAPLAKQRESVAASSKDLDAVQGQMHPGERSPVTSSCPLPSPAKAFEGVPRSACVTIELFAGSAGRSAALSVQGCETLAIDHKGKERLQKCPCVELDLSCGQS